MSGRAIILLVVGIIIISGTILYRIEAGSVAIVVNSAGYQKKQSVRNIAQSGVNLALRQLENNSTWRTGFTSLKMLSGSVSVKVFDTTFAGISTAIGVRSTGTAQESSATSTAFCYFPQPLIPPIVKGLITTNASNDVNGSITVDGEDHNPYSTVVNAGKGTYGAWTTGASFSLSSGSAKLGGTALGVDFIPTNPANPAVVLVNQTYPGGFPNTPDSAFGGPSFGYSEGTLKAIAQSSVGGSQYVTDPALLRYPLSGVTYVEMPTASPTWPSATITGTGILIVHNSAKNAVFKTAGGTFAGIIFADDISQLHCQTWGAIVALTSTPSGSVMGNGSSNAYYSRKAILNAVGMLTNGTGLKVIAWWE